MKNENFFVNTENETNEREKHIYKRIFAIISSFLFVIFFLLFGIISFLDKDAVVSEKENRKLAEKPKFTFSALFDGTYITDFENYYSDTFPLRDSFINLNKKITGVLTQFGGKDDNVIISINKDDGGNGEGVELSTKENKTENKTESKTENKTEKKTRTVKETEGSVKGALLISGKRAMEIFTFVKSTSESYAKLVNKVADSMPENVNVYSLLAPTSVEFYGGRTYCTGVHSQKTAIDTAYKAMNKRVKTVDAYSFLEEAEDEYIYFRTDHHWTARGAYCGYKAFCEASGNTPVDINVLETGKIDGFVGSLYKTSNANVLKDNPDYVEYFKTRVDVDGKVYQSSEMKDGIKFFIVARSVNSSNKYLAFIAGDQPLEKIVTSNKNGKKILVTKESYGNALVPFLCDNYEEVYVVDPRNINFNLPKFMKDNSIENILMINYTFAMSNKRFCDALGEMIK